MIWPFLNSCRRTIALVALTMPSSSQIEDKTLRYSRLISCDDVSAYLLLLAARQHRGFPNMVRDRLSSAEGRFHTA